MSENALARWRGRHVGIIFQFFQLIPTLTALENVLLALELGGGGGSSDVHGENVRSSACNWHTSKTWPTRLPSELSGVNSSALLLPVRLPMIRLYRC